MSVCPAAMPFNYAFPEVEPLSLAPLKEGRAPEALDLPPGWEVVDKDFTAEIRSHPPSTAEMVGVLRIGMLPTWRLVLSTGRAATRDR